jgi:acyl CoA:acetate/3-ketoacid CoA transferase beta subunit/acyl CoA:acetate/3-ketoacid CoA transferase alpha subunit
MSKLLELPEAIVDWVRPGQHLHFASTPSRSNAAIREIARRFRGQRPEFTVSATGFHSMAHLFGILRLGKRYIGCFFGDNYPVPRPNPLYEQLRREGAELEQWSLLSYVSALHAGALGNPYAVTRSLRGSSLGRDLAERGKYFEVGDPLDPAEKVGLVAALRPDLAFVHAPIVDENGYALATPPYGDGFYGALGARDGIIVTAEKVVPAGALRGSPHLLPLDPARIVAVCEEPLGAHPQPLHLAQQVDDVASYDDDYEHYLFWRNLASDEKAFAAFSSAVLDAADGGAAYRALVRPADAGAPTEAAPVAILRGARSADVIGKPIPQWDLPSTERMIVLAARAIAARVTAAGHRTILAGIGHAFAAARLAERMLAFAGTDVDVVIETGIAGVDCKRADSFLLSRRNIARARRLTSIEDVLGILVCGSDNHCLGVIGAAQVDPQGDVNSTFVHGELVVGSGGANDIASAASEVIVLAPCDARRIVPRVEYVTSPGRNVTHLATDRCVLARESAGLPWRMQEVVAPGGLSAAVRALEDLIPWAPAAFGGASRADPLSPLELEFIGALRAADDRAPNGGARL